MNRPTYFALPAMAAALALVSGCGGVTELTKEQVAKAETAVTAASQALGNREAGAIDLQRAKDTLSQARVAVKDGEDKLASHLAQLAELDAQLSLAKAQSTEARKAADALLASIETLRQEALKPGFTLPAH